MTITEFLMARFDEQEARAQRAMADWEDQDWVELDGDPLDHIHANNPHAVLADIAAKRAIVAHETRSVKVKLNAPAMHTVYDSQETTHFYDEGHQIVMPPEAVEEWYATWTEQITDTPVLRILASAYADHPDYREEWRP